MAKSTKTQSANNGNEVAEQSLHICECGRFEVEIEGAKGAEDATYRTTHGTAICGAYTTRTFAPGHDAKLKSLLIWAGVRNHSVRRNSDGVASIDDAMSWAEHYGFGHQVKAGIVRAARKLSDRATAREARDLAKATKPTRVTKVRTSKRTLVREATIKIGRWTYEAVIDSVSNEATFTSASGEVKTAPAGKYSIVTK